jgi:hypothetical protein
MVLIERNILLVQRLFPFLKERIIQQLCRYRYNYRLTFLSSILLILSLLLSHVTATLDCRSLSVSPIMGLRILRTANLAHGMLRTESCARRTLRTESCTRVTCAQNKKFIFYRSTVNNSTSRITSMYAEGLPGLIFSRFLFPQELFIADLLTVSRFQRT